MREILFIGFIFIACVVCAGYLAFDEGYYKGLNELCKDGEIGIDKKGDIECYETGVIDQINIRNMILNQPRQEEIKFDYNKT